MEPPQPHDEKPLRVFLSGGGYRAALASIGALLALHDLGQMARVREITSVSGGGLVNSWLAVRQPEPDELVDELDTVALVLASRANTLRAAALPGFVVAVWTACTAVLLCLLARESPGQALLLAVLWVVLTPLCVQLFVARWWLRRLYSSFGGDRAANGLPTRQDWRVRHTFVASDLCLSGSVFFSLIRGRLIAFSSRRGIYEPTLTLSTLLRASTALPPALPPIRVNLGTEAQLPASSKTALRS